MSVLTQIYFFKRSERGMQEAVETEKKINGDRGRKRQKESNVERRVIWPAMFGSLSVH